ncbi:glycosyltransferase family 87 protein [Thermodesulfobacteriota bacterium]
MVVDPNFLDLAYHYVWGDLLNKGVNPFTYDKLNQEIINFLSTTPDLNIPNLSKITYLSFLEPLNYSPAYISVMSFFSRMSFTTVVYLWATFSYITLIASILLLLKIQDVNLNKINLAICSFIVFSFSPVIECTVIGQTGTFILFFLVLFIWYDKKEQPYLSAFFLSIVIQIKPHYGIIALLFLSKKMYKPFFATIFFYCLIDLVFVPVVGIESYVVYFKILLPFIDSTYENAIWLHNLSPLSSALRLFSENMASIIKGMYFIFAVIILIYVYKNLIKSSKNIILPSEVAIMTCLALFLPPFLEDHHLVLLLVPIIIIFYNIKNLSRFWQLSFIVGYLLVALKYSLIRFSIFTSGLPSLFYNGKLYGLIIIGIVTFIYWKKNTKVACGI